MIDIDFSSKRAKLAIRFFTYGVMTVASVVLTTLLIFVALGYRFDRNFTFAQGGLLQFRSFPDNASITIDDKKQGYRTPNKANLPAGQHTVQIGLDGYRSWSKTVDLAPGQLLWLNYARLIPNTITTSTLKEYPTIFSSLPSPDHRWFLMQMTKDAPNFVLVDFGDDKKPQYTSLQLPDSLFTKKDNKLGAFQVVEWDLQSKFVLIKHENGDLVEYIRMDRSKPNDAVNLSKLFGLTIKLAHFSGNNANTIFAKTDDVLRRLDVDGPTASAALVTGLRDFTVYGEDTIAFTNVLEQTTGDATSQQQQIGVYRNGKITPVRTASLGQPILLAYNEYDNHDYLAVSSADSSKVDIIRDATVTGASKQANIFAQLDLGASVQSISFSNSGRMLIAQHGKQFATYDIETAKTYAKTLDFGTDDMPQLKWLDDFYIWSDAGGKLRIVEFDGMNDREITTVSPGYGVMLDANGRQLLSIGKNEVSRAMLLQASKLTLNN
jgi:PEGA domain